MRSPSKEVNLFMDEVSTYCREAGRRIAWEFGGSHIKVRDAETMRSITDRDGCPLTVPTTPSDWRWMQNCRTSFRRAGLLPKSQPKVPKPMSRGAALSLPDRVGRSLRSDLTSATRRALLRDIAELARLAAQAQRLAA